MAMQDWHCRCVRFHAYISPHNPKISINLVTFSLNFPNEDMDLQQDSLLEDGTVFIYPRCSFYLS